MRRVRGVVTALAIGAVLVAAGCGAGGHVEGTLTYPPPRQPGEAPLPSPRPPAPPRPLAPKPPAPKRHAPAGIYFLQRREAGLDHCTYMGERVTGAETPLHRPEAEARRRAALLELAREARAVGGNVVLLPHFAEDYRSGRVLGRIYRCDEARRRTIYRHAAATRQLTVLPP